MLPAVGGGVGSASRAGTCVTQPPEPCRVPPNARPGNALTWNRRSGFTDGMAEGSCAAAAVAADGWACAWAGDRCGGAPALRGSTPLAEEGPWEALVAGVDVSRLSAGPRSKNSPPPTRTPLDGPGGEREERGVVQQRGVGLEGCGLCSRQPVTSARCGSSRRAEALHGRQLPRQQCTAPTAEQSTPSSHRPPALQAHPVWGQPMPGQRPALP